MKLREHNVVTTCFPDVTLGQRIPDVGVTSCVCWVVVIKRYLSEKVVKIKFKITMVKVGGKHQVQTPPRYNWNIVESGVQHHKLNQARIQNHHFISGLNQVQNLLIFINSKSISLAWLLLLIKLSASHFVDSSSYVVSFTTFYD